MQEMQKRFKVNEITHEKLNGKYSECKGELSDPRKFNLMMKTFVGPVEDEAIKTCLKAEPARNLC